MQRMGKSVTARKDEQNNRMAELVDAAKKGGG